MKLSNSFSGALRTFAYFLASGTHIDLEGVDYLGLYGSEPSAIEAVFAIFANVIEMDPDGRVLNAREAEQRACASLRSYCDRGYEVDPPFEQWEIALY